jgi:hypothetical protein
VWSYPHPYVVLYSCPIVYCLSDMIWSSQKLENQDKSDL